MKTSSAKILGSVASSVMLVSAGAAAAVPAVSAAMGDDGVAYAAVEEAAAVDVAAPAAKVQGEFSYTQAKVTSNAEISGVFAKAVAAMCASMPEYGVAVAAAPIAITGGTTLEATVEDMQADEAAEAVLMACACASNVAGGGAMANADVSGVTIASVAALAQAL